MYNRPVPTQNPGEDWPTFWTRYLASLTVRELQTVATQDRYLKAYSELGTVTHAADRAGIVRWTAYEWHVQDAHHFRVRLEKARDAFVDSLESIALTRVKEPAGNRGSDVLLMGMLNANHPGKWRRDVTVIGGDLSKDILSEVRKLTAQRLASAVTVEPVPDTAEERVVKMLEPGES